MWNDKKPNMTPEDAAWVTLGVLGSVFADAIAKGDKESADWLRPKIQPAINKLEEFPER